MTKRARLEVSPTVMGVGLGAGRSQANFASPSCLSPSSCNDVNVSDPAPEKPPVDSPVNAEVCIAMAHTPVSNVVPVRLSSEAARLPSLLTRIEEGKHPTGSAGELDIVV